MSMLPLGPVVAGTQVARRALHSARPDAPVVPDRRPVAARPVLRRTRDVTATALHRAAHRIAAA